MMAEPTERNPSGVRPRWVITVIFAWVLIQIPRLIAVPLVRDVLDDLESDAWLYPAILDIVVAIAAPFVAYAIWRRRGLAVWVSVVIFFVVSILDHGDAVTAGLTSPAPRIFGGPEGAFADIPAVVPLIQTVIDLVMLILLTGKKMRAYFLGTA